MGDQAKNLTVFGALGAPFAVLDVIAIPITANGIQRLETSRLGVRPFPGQLRQNVPTGRYHRYRYWHPLSAFFCRFGLGGVSSFPLFVVGTLDQHDMVVGSD